MNTKISNLKDYISSKYDIGILNLTPVKNVIRITTEKGDKCLKRVKYGKGHFLFIMSAIQHLVKNGFDGVLPFITTKEGADYIELEDGFGFLIDWISCRECNYSNPIDLKMAAVALSRLHKCSEGYMPPEGSEPRIGWGKWVEKFSARIDEMHMFKKIALAKENHSYFDRVYIENVDYYIRQGERAVEHLKETRYFKLSETEREKGSFCHHDFAHHNVLITDDLEVRIIDFDYCICDTRIHDLSSLIIRNMRHGNWNDMEKAQYIIDCYLKEGHIDKGEIPIMNAFIEFPQDFWQVGLQYYIEKLKWEESQFNKRLDNCIKDKYDRQYFIEEFKFSIEI